MPTLPTRRRDARAAAGHAVALGLASLVAYLVVTRGLGALRGAVDAADTRLGGMWAVLSTVFVFRETSAQRAGLATSRLVATLVSVVLCELYLLAFGFTPVGLAAVIAVGVVVVHALGRPDDAVTASITTAVVLVVAGLGPRAGSWEQPLLRLADTAVGVAVGLAAAGCLRVVSARRPPASR